MTAPAPASPQEAKPAAKERLLSGIALGLAVASVAWLVLHYLAGSYVAGAVERSGDDQLHFQRWVGLEPPSLMVVLSGVVLLLSIVGGIIVQRKPLFTIMARPLAAGLSLLVAAIMLVGSAALCVYVYHMAWSWLLL